MLHGANVVFHDANVCCMEQMHVAWCQCSVSWCKCVLHGASEVCFCASCNLCSVVLGVRCVV